MSEPLDLEAIKKRAEIAAPPSASDSPVSRFAKVTAARELIDSDVPALVAEVERLRAERADIWDAGSEAQRIYRADMHRFDRGGTLPDLPVNPYR